MRHHEHETRLGEVSTTKKKAADRAVNWLGRLPKGALAARLGSDLTKRNGPKPAVKLVRSRGRPASIPNSDHLSVAAAVELTRRKFIFKPIRKEGVSQRIGNEKLRSLISHPWNAPYVGNKPGERPLDVCSLVSICYLGGKIGPESVWKIYGKHREQLPVSDRDVGNLACDLIRRYNPSLHDHDKISEQFFLPLGDRPFENPRHLRHYRSNLLRPTGFRIK